MVVDNHRSKGAIAYLLYHAAAKVGKYNQIRIIV